MKAAVLKSPFEIELEDVPVPPMAHPNDVLVRVRATAVCGTDVAVYKGKQKAKLPLIMGHEATGEVAEAGSAVVSLEPGDRVAINPTISCGLCFACLQGRTNICIRGGLMVREADGSYAEYAVVPENRLFKLPDSVSFVDGTTIALMTTVAYAQRRVGIQPGDVVAVFGVGASGLLHVQLARRAGACKVIAASRSKWKLDMARRLGADPVVNSLEADPVEVIFQETGGLGADVVIEAAGTPETVRQSLEAVRPGGRVLQFGIPGPEAQSYNLQALYYKDLTVVGSRAMQPTDFIRCIEMVRNGLDISYMVTHRFPLEKIEEALTFSERNPGQVLRIVVES